MNPPAIKRKGALNDERRLEKPIQASAILQHEVIEALLNSERIHLNNFLPTNEALDELPPLPARVDICDLSDSASVGLAVSSARERMDRRRIMIRWLLVTIGSLLLAYSAYIIGQKTSHKDISEPAWQVVQVTPSGLSLMVTHPSGNVVTHVPVGGILPDGQRLSRVDPSRQIYSTNLQDVRIKSVSGPANE